MDLLRTAVRWFRRPFLSSSVKASQRGGARRPDLTLAARKDAEKGRLADNASQERSDVHASPAEALMTVVP